MHITVQIPDHDWQHFAAVAQDREIDAEELAQRTLARCAEGVRRGSNEADAVYNFETVIAEMIAEREAEPPRVIDLTAAEIVQLLLADEMTQREIAVHSGVDASQINRLASDQRSASEETWRKLAALLIDRELL